MAKDDIDISLMFKMEPEEAVNYLKNKGYKITDNWHEMLAELSVHFTSIGNVIGLSALKHISGEPFSEIEQN